MRRWSFRREHATPSITATALGYVSWLNYARRWRANSSLPVCSTQPISGVQPELTCSRPPRSCIASTLGWRWPACHHNFSAGSWPAWLHWAACVGIALKSCRTTALRRSIAPASHGASAARHPVQWPQWLNHGAQCSRVREGSIAQGTQQGCPANQADQAPVGINNWQAFDGVLHH